MVRTLSSNIVGAGSIFTQGAKIPRASRPKKQNKTKQKHKTEAILQKIQLKLLKWSIFEKKKKNEMMKGEMIEAS